MFASVQAVIGAARRENKVFASSCSMMMYAARCELRWKKRNNELQREIPRLLGKCGGHMVDHS